MTMIVEDGSVVPNCNSYVTVAWADDYHTTYGNTDWTSITDTTQKELALINATQSIELLYGQRYLSLPLAHFPLQNLLFPRFLMVINRIQVISSNSIPIQLKRAVAEVALKFINSEDIFPLPNTDNFLKSKDLEISGGPKKSVTWAKLPYTEELPGFNKIELILKPLLRQKNSSMIMSL